MSGLLLSGNIFIDRLDDTGQPTGAVGPINVTKLEIKVSADEKVRESMKKDSYGQALDIVQIGKPTECTIDMDDQPAELLAMALLGDTATVNTGSGSVTDELVTLPANSRWVKLAQANLATAGVSALLAADDSAVDATEYEINYALGMARAVAGGALAAGVAIKLSYSHNAISGTVIKGGLRPQINAHIYGDMKNLATGKAANLDIPFAILAPTSAVDFMASDFVSTTLAGKLKLAEGKTEPFTYTQIDS